MRGKRPPLLWFLAAVALAGCGGSGSGHRLPPAPSKPPVHANPFAWLLPTVPPAGWAVARTPGGALMPYPPGWRRVRGDRGTVSVALLNGERYAGYLNATPLQGDETLANWTHFRPDHNAEEGEKQVRTLAGATGLAFPDGGRGSCVKDSYVTGTGSSYVELACLVEGSRRTAVIVGAAPPASWAAVAPLLQRAISAFRV